MESSGAELHVQSINIINEFDKFSIAAKFKKPTKIWRYPNITVSGSEAGLEKVYQSSVIMPNWKIDLKPNEKKKFEFQIIIEEL
jgi:hypothetical protein